MTKEELLEKAVVIQFPLTTSTYKHYDLGDKPLHLLALRPNSMYHGFNLNNNHFLPWYHREEAIPIISGLLGLEWPNDNFELVDRKSKDGFDLSYLRPIKDEMRFSIHGLERDEHEYHVHYERLVNGKIGPTEYHKQFAYPHECSIVVNETLNSPRMLFISGDSQMIPLVPWLCCQFKEVWYFDNRGKKTFKSHYEGKEFSDVLFELNCNDLTKYTTTNLK